MRVKESGNHKYVLGDFVSEGQMKSTAVESEWKDDADSKHDGTSWTKRKHGEEIGF